MKGEDKITNREAVWWKKKKKNDLKLERDKRTARKEGEFNWNHTNMELNDSRHFLSYISTVVI